MKECLRKIRSRTQSNKRPQRVEIYIEIADKDDSDRECKQETILRSIKVENVEDTKSQVSYQQPKVPTGKSKDKVYCKECEKYINSRNDYLRHIRKDIHLRMATKKPLPPNTLPDIADQNHYCRVCNKTLSSSAMYRKHLRFFHRMKLGPLDKSHFYCTKCNKEYVFEASYQNHLQDIHGVKLQELKNAKQPDPDDPNNHCDVCDVSYLSKYNYRGHLKKVHKIVIPRQNARCEPDPNIIPDYWAPDLYCKSCKKQYKSRCTYRPHLKNVHNIFPPEVTKKSDPTVQPDYNDPNFFCKSCQIKYNAKCVYKTHLQRVHKMEFEPVINKPIFDPTNDLARSCLICKRTYVSAVSYRSHVKKFHKKKGGENEPTRGASRVNPDIKPDPHDPNFYCRSCRFTYSSKKTYRKHIRVNHTLDVNSK